MKWTIRILTWKHEGIRDLQFIEVLQCCGRCKDIQQPYNLQRQRRAELINNCAESCSVHVWALSPPALTFSCFMCLSSLSSRYERRLWIRDWKGLDSFFTATFCRRTTSYAELERGNREMCHHQHTLSVSEMSKRLNQSHYCKGKLYLHLHNQQYDNIIIIYNFFTLWLFSWN